jgi:thymidine kinase
MSNKSSTLLNKLSQDAAINKQVLYINHCIDTRTKNVFSTHNPLLKNFLTMKNLTMIKCEELPELNEVLQYDTIGIDEFSFFKNYKNIIQYVEEGKKRVICVGLIADSNREKFGHLLDLILICDSYTPLYAHCVPCSQETKQSLPALFTHRYASDTNEQIEVGASDKYIPVCRHHYLLLNK